MAYDVYRLYKGAYYVSGSRWEDSDLPLVEWHDSGSGTYTTNWYYVSTCYDTWPRRWIDNGITAPRWLQPNSILSYKAPSSISAHISDTAQYLKIRIESVDGTRWCQLLINDSTREATYTDSQSQNETSSYGYPNYSGRIGIGTLHANTNGTVTYSAGYDTPYDSSCSSSWTTILSNTTASAVFNTDEELIVKYLFSYGSDTTWSPNQFGFDLTLTSTSDQLEWLYATFDELTCTIGATQDNSTSNYGTLKHNHINATSEEQTAWLTQFDHINITHFWYTLYHRMTQTGSYVYQAKFVAALNSTYLEWIVEGLARGAITLISEDGLRWVTFKRANSTGFLTVTYNLGTYWTGSVSQPGVNWSRVFVRVEGGNIYFRHEARSYDIITQPPAIPFTSIFNAGEKIIPAFSCDTTFGLVTYIYNHTFMSSMDLPKEGENMIMGTFSELSVDLADAITKQYMCYVRTKIRNSQDYNDPESLYALDPGNPSDANIPLQAGDACIVLEKYNRVYYYVCKAGDMSNNLPLIIRVTDSLYWELVDVSPGAPNIKCEQYDVIGLVDTNEVIITHTKHDRTKSYAPTIQFVQDGVIRTHDLTVAVKSDTELRISTPETSAIQNLKLNVYVNPL